MFFMNEIASLEDLNQVATQLKNLAEIILKHSISRCFVTSEESAIPKLEKSLQSFLARFPSSVSKTNIGDKKESDEARKSYFAIPGTVNYVASSIEGLPYTNPDSPTLKVVAQLLSNCFLHRELREKGGAYGGGASSSTVFNFYSYRDPNVLKTLETFLSSIQWVSKGEFTDRDIEEAKLSIFAVLDAPDSPSSKGSSEWISGIDYEMKQLWRDRLFAVSRKDIQRAADKYLMEQAKKAPVAVVGSDQNKAQFENNPEWKFISCV